MSKFGLQVSSTGKNVKTADSLNKSIDAPDLALLKTFKQGSASIDVTASGTFTVEVTHGLGYHPIVIYFIAPDPNNPTRKFFGSSAANGVGGGIANEMIITKNTVKFAWSDTTTSGYIGSRPYKVTFYYYIFADPLEL